MAIKCVTHPNTYMSDPPKPGRASWSSGSRFWPGALGSTQYRQIRCLDLTSVTLTSQQVICPSGEVPFSLHSTALSQLKLSSLFIVVWIFNSSISEIEKCNDKINIPEYCVHSLTHREMALVRDITSFLSPLIACHTSGHAIISLLGNFQGHMHGCYSLPHSKTPTPDFMMATEEGDMDFKKYLFFILNFRN